MARSSVIGPRPKKSAGAEVRGWILRTDKFVSLLRESSKSAVAYAEIPGAQHAFDIFHSLRSTIVIESVARFLSTLYSDARQRGYRFIRGTRP
jgi:hypothetical protein